MKGVLYMDDLIRESSDGRKSESDEFAGFFASQERMEKLLRKALKGGKGGKKKKKKEKRWNEALRDFGAKFLGSLTAEVVKKKFFS
jgi:hypothetical protein